MEIGVLVVRLEHVEENFLWDPLQNREESGETMCCKAQREQAHAVPSTTSSLQTERTVWLSMIIPCSYLRSVFHSSVLGQ